MKNLMVITLLIASTLSLNIYSVNNDKIFGGVGIVTSILCSGILLKNAIKHYHIYAGKEHCSDMYIDEKEHKKYHLTYASLNLLRLIPSVLIGISSYYRFKN